jgi:hypothetical protein
LDQWQRWEVRVFLLKLTWISQIAVWKERATTSVSSVRQEMDDAVVALGDWAERAGIGRADNNEHVISVLEVWEKQIQQAFVPPAGLGHELDYLAREDVELPEWITSLEPHTLINKFDSLWEMLQSLLSEVTEAFAKLAIATVEEDRELLTSLKNFWTGTSADEVIQQWLKNETDPGKQKEAIAALRGAVLDTLRRTATNWPAQQVKLLNVIFTSNGRSIVLRLVGANLPKRPPDPALLAREIQFKINSTAKKLGAEGLNSLERHLPRLEIAVAEIPALKKVSPDKALARIQPFEDWVNQGFARMQYGVLVGVGNGVYAQFAQKLDQVGQQLQAAVMRPVMGFVGLSREAGALAGQNADDLKLLARTTKEDFNKFQAAGTALAAQWKDSLKGKLDNLGISQEKLQELEAQIGEHALNGFIAANQQLDSARAELVKVRELLDKAAENLDQTAIDHARGLVRQAQFQVSTLEGHVRKYLEQFENGRREVEGIIAGYRAAARQAIEGGIAEIGQSIQELRQQAEQAKQALLQMLQQKVFNDFKKQIKDFQARVEAVIQRIEEQVQNRLDEAIGAARAEARRVEQDLAKAAGAERDKLLARKAELEAQIASLQAQVNAVQDEWKRWHDEFESFRNLKLSDLKDKAIKALEEEAKEQVGRAKDEAKKWLQEQAKQIDIAGMLPADLKLLGSLQINQLIALINDYSKFPQIVTREFPERVEVSWNWETAVQRKDFHVIEFIPLGSKQFKLASLTRTELPLPGRRDVPPPLARVDGSLDAFEVLLAECIRIHLDKITFESGTGRPTRVIPDGLRVSFEGPLAFVAKLEEFLRSLTGANGLTIRLDRNFIFVGLSLALQPMTFGGFSLSNVRLNTSLGLPLADGRMRYRFSFCERDSPFLLTVSAYAGGGFLGIEIDSAGDRLIEGALEFGGAVALNLGPALGQVQVMGGFYFCSTRTTLSASGYLRIAGNLNILGWIDVSMEIVIGLTYQREGAQAIFAGYARLQVSVKIGFFSRSFSFQIYRRFAGSGRGNSNNSADSRSLSQPENAMLALEERRMVGWGGGDAPTPAEGATTGGEIPDVSQNTIGLGDWTRYWRAFAN